MSDEASIEASDGPFIWCPIANVSRDAHPEGPDDAIHFGLKHFSPGAKLYCLSLMWGDGGNRITVLGRHRGGGPKLIEIITSTKWLVNWRVRKVFHPHIIRAMYPIWDDTEASRVKAQNLVDGFIDRIERAARG